MSLGLHHVAVSLWIRYIYVKGFLITSALGLGYLVDDEKPSFYTGANRPKKVWQKGKTNRGLRVQHILPYAQSETRGRSLLALGTQKEDWGCLSFLRLVNILNTNKSPTLLRRGESHPVRAAVLSLHTLFDVCRRELIMKRLNILILLIGPLEKFSLIYLTKWGI